MKKKSSPPADGFQWPPECGGSTTKAAKDIWSEVANAAGDSELQRSIRDEKDWRFHYVPHVVGCNEHLGTERWRAAATAGLDRIYSKFVFRDASKGEVKSVKELADTPVNPSVFETVVVEGRGDLPSSHGLPFEGKVFHDGDASLLLSRWGKVGICEPDVAERWEKTVPLLSGLRNRWFVVLGASSEMGPLKFLLDWGAHVIALRRPNPKQWPAMRAYAERSAGTMYTPLAPEHRGSEEMCGADLLRMPIEIRDWICGVVPRDVKDVTVGNYTYLKGEALIRITLACDVIMSGLETEWDDKCVRLAFIGSPSSTSAVSSEAYHSMEANRQRAPLWMRMSGAPLPPRTPPGPKSDVHLVHNFSVTQGPNYALGKTMCIWRACLARTASYNQGPASKTTSVMQNKTFAQIMDATTIVPPIQPMFPDTARVVCSILLAHDVLIGEEEDEEAPSDDAGEHGGRLLSTRIDRYPLNRTRTGAFHGGLLRSGYSIESTLRMKLGLYVLARLGFSRKSAISSDTFFAGVGIALISLALLGYTYVTRSS